MRTYADMMPDYQEYLRTQMASCLLESGNSNYVISQTVVLNEHCDDLPRTSRILDIACGDGTGLKILRAMGFHDLHGVELQPWKAQHAKETGATIHEVDMHDLSVFADEMFDLVYSSHTIEHAYRPRTMVGEIHRVLRPGGRLLVVLPYPDADDGNLFAHGAKEEIGTNQFDNATAVRTFFESIGFHTEQWSFHARREPEVHLAFTKNGQSQGDHRADAPPDV